MPDANRFVDSLQIHTFRADDNFSFLSHRLAAAVAVEAAEAEFDQHQPVHALPINAMLLCHAVLLATIIGSVAIMLHHSASNAVATSNSILCPMSAKLPIGPLAG